MEDILEDITTKKTLNFVKEFRGIIVDCAKNIKSNDATFNISTLPEVTGQLDSFMTSYINAVQKLESSERAFLNLHAQYEELEREREANGEDDPDNPEHNNDPEAGFQDVPTWEATFKSMVQNDDVVTDQIDAQVDLDEIVRPQQSRRPRQDQEDIVVEAPEREIPKDPITKRPIEIAVFCKRCKHIYDKASIEAYFSQKEVTGGKVRCPVAGCRVKDMRRNELLDDEETNKLIESITNSNED